MPRDPLFHGQASEVHQGPLFGAAVICPIRHNPSSVDDLYAEYSPYISSVIRRLTDDSETRRDLNGEAYLAFRKLVDRFDPTRGIPLKPYLLSQLKAHLYSRCRTRRGVLRRETRLSEVDAPAGHAADPTLAWDRDLDMRRLMGALPDLLAGVPDRQRRVIIWRYIEGATYEEISQRLGVQPATARSLLRHGLTRLRTLAARLDHS